MAVYPAVLGRNEMAPWTWLSQRERTRVTPTISGSNEMPNGPLLSRGEMKWPCNSYHLLEKKNGYVTLLSREEMKWLNTHCPVKENEMATKPLPPWGEEKWPHNRLGELGSGEK